MNKEQDSGMVITKGPEVKMRGPRSIDPFALRLTAAGLILYDVFTFRRLLDTGYVTIDFEKRTASLEWRKRGNRG